jgi:hypothetical protein
VSYKEILKASGLLVEQCDAGTSKDLTPAFVFTPDEMDTSY